MKRPLNYPKSFLTLIVTGFAIVTVPLLLGLVSNAFSIERLFDQSQSAVQQAVQVTQATRAIAAAATSLGRTAKGYVVTGDARYFDAYRTGQTSFQATLKQFTTWRLADEQRELLAAIKKDEERLFAELLLPVPSQERLPAIDKQVTQLEERANDLSAISKSFIDSEVDTLREYATRSKNRVFWQMLATIPTVFLLIAIFTFLLSRPIRQLDKTIRRLGDGQFTRPVSVDGPQDIMQLGERLEWLRLKLLELEEQKSRFLQHISHELKTPLTALREGSDLLTAEVAGKLNAEQREIAEILQANSIELRRLIEDLINYSSVSAQSFYLSASITQMREVILRVVRTQKIALVPKALKLQLNCEKITAYADAEKFRVIVDNLLSNAIKYSPLNGTITIRLYKDNEEAVLEVSDEGTGIPEAERPRVFEPFYRVAEPDSEAQVKGTGLGLSIVREYVKLHQGTIEIFDPPAESPNAPRGAHFRVRLPRKQASTALEAA